MNLQATGQSSIADVERNTDAQVASRSTAVIGASIAAAALGVVVLLALSSQAQPTHADHATLLGLAVLAAICLWTPLSRWCAAADGSGTFALTAAMFIIYGMARQVTPPGDKGALHFASMPDDVFPVSYAAYVVVLGALATAPFWMRAVTGWTKAVLLGLTVVAVTGFGIFNFLSGYYQVGATEVVDPTPLVHLGLQVVEYAALALVCNATGLHAEVRRWVLRALPLVLVALWLRHHFTKPPVEEAQ